MRFGRDVCLVVCLASSSLLAADDVYEIKPVAEDVYAAIARPHRPENANSAIVILEDGVLVVDAASTPSSARALIEQIRRLTSKPVQYLVNTHFHWDHYWGNAAFIEAFPGVQIIASENTRQDMQRMGLGSLWVARLTKVELPEAFEQWKAQLARETDLQRMRLLRDRMEQWSKADEELKKMPLALPTMTFEGRMVLHSATQPVEILDLGRGHTSGDVEVYLSKSKVIMAGDLIAGDTPFIADVSPYEWMHTLDAIEQLDFDTVIPGHGDVMRGRNGLRLWRDYFHELMAQAETAYSEGLPIDDAVKRVSARLMERFKDRFPPEFPQALPGNVRAAYRFLSGVQD
ncbi:MAG: MBL fold metallo-hydrolase [Terriglobia bacterium]